MADNSFFPAIALIGGGQGALDGIPTANLADNDVAIVVTDGGTYKYRLDATSGATEKSPVVIKPDDETGDKRWILRTSEIYIDPTCADQGAASATADKSIKDFVDSIGTSRYATLILSHTGSGDTTVYQLSTSDTIPSNITLEIENGAILNNDISIRNADYKWTQSTKSQLVEDCEDAWDELVDADVTSTADTSDYKVGAASAKLVVADAVAAGDILATEAITSLDISGYTYIRLWIKSSVATNSGDLQLLLDDTAQCASPLETIDIPALTADTWTQVNLPLANRNNDTAIISVGLKYTVDIGACTIHLDDLQATSPYEYYLEATAGGDPGISEPYVCTENGSDLTAGTAGSLAAGEWDWADNDTLGYSTVYVRLSDSTDPDGKAEDYVKAGYKITIEGAFDHGLSQCFSGDGKVSFGDGAINRICPEWWGMTSGSVSNEIRTNNTAAIQAALDALNSGSVLELATATYQTNDVLNINTNFIRIKGVSTDGTIIQNCGSNQTFYVTSNFVTFETMSIRGDGGNYGDGASGTYGIEFDGAVAFEINRCDIRYHGNHGIYVHGESWWNVIINSVIIHNAGSGFYSVSNTSAEQNGNNTTIIGSRFSSNASNGITWAANALGLYGNDCSTNKSSGILIDADTAQDSANGVDISGNYFEENYDSQIHLKRGSSVVSAVSISGNYIKSFYEGDGAGTSLIKCTGNLLGINIKPNYYSMSGAVLTTALDAPGLQPDCFVEVTGDSSYWTNANFGLAKVHSGTSKVVSSGYLDQTGITYNALGERSADCSRTDQDGRYRIPVKGDTYIKEISIFIATDSTSYNVELDVEKSSPTQTGFTNIANDTFSGLSNNQTVTLSVDARVDDGDLISARVRITGDTTSGYMYVYDLVTEIN